MKRLAWLPLGILLMAVLSPPVCLADADLENASLSNIIHVLDSLTPLINQAEQQHDPTARVQFNYPALREDIQKIKQGVRRKWEHAPLEPHPVAPIQGDYLHLQSKHA